MNPNFNGNPNNINFMPNQNFNPFFFNNPNMFPMNNNFNNFFNPNLMNNQIPMMQMNQMNQMNQINQINQMNQMMMQNMQNVNNQNNDIPFINQNQKMLVDKIINFYQGTGRIYMNYDEPNQIKQLLNNLDTNSPLLKEANDIVDPLHYINEKKKLIKFINHDFKIYNVKVPISIDKKTLYQIAYLYQTLENNSQILLVYMNCILNKDESSIDSISDGDFVIIIENIYYKDDSYFNALQNINYNGIRKNVPIKKNGNGLFRNLAVPDNIKFSQVFKALVLLLGCEYWYIYRGKKLHVDNKVDDIEILEGYPIECYEYEFIITYIIIFGKEINLKINYTDKNGKISRNLVSNYIVGILNSIKEFVEMVEAQKHIKVKEIYFEGKRINFNEDRSFSSLGIKEDCNIIIYF